MSTLQCTVLSYLVCLQGALLLLLCPWAHLVLCHPHSTMNWTAKQVYSVHLIWLNRGRVVLNGNRSLKNVQLLTLVCRQASTVRVRIVQVPSLNRVYQPLPKPLMRRYCCYAIALSPVAHWKAGNGPGDKAIYTISCQSQSDMSTISEINHQIYY